MPVPFSCPACRRTIAADVPPGTQVQCPLCRQIVVVPGIGPSTGWAQGVAPGPMPGQFAGEGQWAGGVSLEPPRTGLAIGALVCGIVGFVGCMPVGLVGLILGIVALVRSGREPARYGGKGMAIGGVCTGALSILLLPLLISILLPSLSRARELSKRTVCAANMLAIGQVLYIYASNDSNAMFPEPGMAWQARLLSTRGIEPRHLLCPSDSRTSGCSYYYVPGFRADANPNQIILYEDLAYHGGEGGNILYKDGRVVFEKSPKFEELINSITLPDGTPWAPHKDASGAGP